MMVVMPKFKIVQKLIDNINGVMRENLTGIRVVRAFNAEEYQEDKFDSANTSLTNQQLFNQKRFAILSPIMYLVMNSLTLAIYFIGAYLINAAQMADKISLFGDMVVFSSYAMQVIMSFLMLAMIFMMLPRAQVSASRINEVLDTLVSVKDGDKEESGSEVGTVEFRNVSFKYPDAEEYLLKNISFKANKGETVAFIGSTGSGKSTLINLVPRFYDAVEGEVLVDGINVKEYKLEALYNKIGYVPQKAVIFNGSVSFNVGYGNNGKKKSDKDIKEAIDVAQAKEFVSKMESGYDSYLASGGTNISGGQKQRIAIARAIARNPEIYIFDDSFSALDYKTDSILRRELKKYTKDATSLIVAQRIGTIMNADKILVLDNGYCVGMGTHEELLKNCSVYKEIALSQLSKEELENGTK
jgi:ATP-binding cassette subfamily B protein